MTNVLVSPTNREFAVAFEHSGLRIFTWPELAVEELDDYFSLDESIDHLFGYDWLLLKNDRAAEFFVRRLVETNHRPASLDDVRTLAIGEATAATLIEAHVHVDILSDRHANRSLIASLESYVGSSEGLSGLNLLFPSANVSREEFETELEERGARVDCVPAYRTTRNVRRLAELKALLAGGGIDAIVFNDANSVEQFARVFDTDDLSEVLKGVSVNCDDEVARAAAIEFALSNVRLTSDLHTATAD